MIKKRYDQVGGLLWVGLGSALCIGSIKLGLGGLHKPGPGFVPFLTGSLLGLLGIILTLHKTIQISRQKGNEGKSQSKIEWKQIGLSLIALFVYASLFEPLGFVISTLLFLLFLFKMLMPRKWFMPILLSVSTVIFSYLIFYVWLRVNFPRGIFRIG